MHHRLENLWHFVRLEKFNLLKIYLRRPESQLPILEKRVFWSLARLPGSQPTVGPCQPSLPCPGGSV